MKALSKVAGAAARTMATPGVVVSGGSSGLSTAQVLADFLGSRGGQSALIGGYAAALPDIPGAAVGAKDIASPRPTIWL